MDVLVTGATGLVGSHLVEALVERGDRVWALVRDPRRASALPPLKGQGVTLVPGDLHDPGSLARALARRRFNVVYHCAARVALPYQGDRQQLFRTNVEGTKHLLRACAEGAGVGRFVFVSSVAVYGDPDPEAIPVTEAHPLRPRGPYAESKAEAEAWVWRYAREGLDCAVVRPCVIYGPRDRNFLPQIVEQLVGKPFPLVDGGHQLLDLVHARDVARALVLAGTRPRASGQAYNVTDGQRHTLREIVETFARLSGLPVRAVSVPYGVALLLAALGYVGSRLRHPRRDPLIAPAAVRAMVKPHHYSIEKIRRELGYEPRVPLEAGLKQTVEWLRRVGAIRGGRAGRAGTGSEEGDGEREREEAEAAYGPVREV